MSARFTPVTSMRVFVEGGRFEQDVNISHVLSLCHFSRDYLTVRWLIKMCVNRYNA